MVLLACLASTQPAGDLLRLAEHTTPHFTGVAAIGLAVCALLGTLYALAFAVLGIRAGAVQDASRSMAGWAEESQAVHFLVIIPAHNEGPGLIATVKSVLAQSYPNRRMRCVVIADNCTDNTAEVAASAGAQVLIRSVPELRGKGHALAWALSLVENLDWEAVCFLDADSIMEPQFLSAMAQSLRKGHQAVQGRYDFLPAAQADNWLQQFSALSKAGENSFVQRSRERLRLLLLLHGNGFCLTRAALRKVPWRAHSIVEDAEYSLALNQAGVEVRYQEQAKVLSRQASTACDMQPQRVRWASGNWHLFRQAIPALWSTAWRQHSGRALEGILMLLLTSRMLLVYLLGVSLLLSLIAAAPLSYVAWTLLATTMALQLLYVMLIFRFAADEAAPLSGLMRLPFYLAVIAWAQFLALLGFNRRLWWRTAR